MKASIVAVPSVDNSLIASNISRPDRNEVCIQILNPVTTLPELASNIEFENDESVSSIKWTRFENSTSITPSKKRRNSESSNIENISTKFTDLLVILLATGEILIYSTTTKEFVNKISTDSPFSAIEVINKIGYSKKALYNYDYDIIAFDSTTSLLKFFSSTSPQLINSVSFKEDANISYIYFNSSILEDDKNTDVELILASNETLYFLNKTHEIIKTIDITLPSSSSSTTTSIVSPTKSSKNSEKDTISTQSCIEKIVKNGSNLYILRTDCSTIQIVDIEKKHSKRTKHKLISTSNKITDFALLKSNNSIVISATLIDGSIELIKNVELINFAKLKIEGGNDVGRFIGLLNDDGNGITDGVYKGIWYDNFNIQITDFEFENLLKLNGTIQISVTELVDPKDENLNFGEDDDDEDDDEVEVEDGEIEVKEVNEKGNDDFDVDDDKIVVEKDNTEITKDVTMIDNAEDYTCTELTQVTEFIRSRLLDSKNEEYDVVLSYILAKNSSFAKSTIYILSAEESVHLFNKIAFIVSHYQSYALNQDFEFISNIKSWLKFLLVLRGTVISHDDEAIGWLKLLQSEFKQEAKTLNNMIKLTGKLSLLKDQLNVRKEMMNRQDDGEDDMVSDDYSEDETNAESGYTIDETTFGDSVVLDGEGGYEDDDDEEDADDNNN